MQVPPVGGSPSLPPGSGNDLFSKISNLINLILDELASGKPVTADQMATLNSLLNQAGLPQNLIDNLKNAIQQYQNDPNQNTWNKLIAIVDLVLSEIPK